MTRPFAPPYYKGFITTTSRSAGAPRDGTQSLTVWPLETLPLAPTAGSSVGYPSPFQRESSRSASRHSMPEPPGHKRHPPGSSRDFCTPRFRCQLIRFRHFTMIVFLIPTDDSIRRLFLIADHDSLQLTQHERLKAIPRRTAPKATFIFFTQHRLQRSSAYYKAPFHVRGTRPDSNRRNSPRAVALPLRYIRHRHGFL